MVQVRVSEGLLEGELVHNEYGGTYCSFKGVPYAQPPLGELRFKAPQPPKSWKGIRSAKELGSSCYQSELLGNRYGSEDCLYLNVYTPDINPDQPLPVMFWIHGGGFMNGSGGDDVHGPKFLVRQGVIVVTINYRLEVLGFLCLETEDVPGNAGMKDQVQALRWVNKNIANFGGDPKNVTIFGVSAGGASVTYHLISPMSKGLFRRAIAQSGVNLCYWAQAYKPRERALALARNLGFYSEDDEELYEFFKNQPVESLVKISASITFSEKARNYADVYFSVVNEKQFGNNERFFFGDILDATSNGIHKGVDVIIGYTGDEGILGLIVNGGIEQSLVLARNYPQYFVSYPMSLNLSVNDQLEMGKIIKNYYFKNQIDIPDDWKKLAKFYAMDMIVFAIIRWLRLCAHTNEFKSYLYKFTCKTELNVIAHTRWKGLLNIPEDEAIVAHTDELLYLFNQRPQPILDINSDTFKLVEKVTTLWTNFAKFGDPTPDDSLGSKWIPYTIGNQDFMDIGNELKACNGALPEEEEIQVWEHVFKQFGQKLY